MSRIGKKEITIPDKVEVLYSNRTIKVKGERGQLERSVHPLVELDINGNTINVVISSNDRKAPMFQGLTRALISNMVVGVSKGFQRSIEINGIGYRAEVKDDYITFNIGYSHPISFEIPVGINAKIEKNVITLDSHDKELLGQTAATIRFLRPPEPYKGKGIKYSEENIQRKAGKTGSS